MPIVGPDGGDTIEVGVLGTDVVTTVDVDELSCVCSVLVITDTTTLVMSWDGAPVAVVADVVVATIVVSDVTVCVEVELILIVCGMMLVSSSVFVELGLAPR